MRQKRSVPKQKIVNQMRRLSGLPKIHKPKEPLPLTPIPKKSRITPDFPLHEDDYTPDPTPMKVPSSPQAGSFDSVYQCEGFHFVCVRLLMSIGQSVKNFVDSVRFNKIPVDRDWLKNLRSNKLLYYKKLNEDIHSIIPRMTVSIAPYLKDSWLVDSGHGGWSPPPTEYVLFLHFVLKH